MAINYTKTNWVDGQAPAISATNLNKIETGIKAAADGVDTLMPPTGSWIEQRTLLWTNSSPTSTFAAQTITLDLTDYDEVRIDYYEELATDGQKVVVTSFCAVGASSRATDAYLAGTSTGDTKTLRRDATASTSGVTFTDGYMKVNLSSSTSAITANTVLVPYKIYGIKEV